jgi:oxygen-dependent protoporphyrinogen oxidase
MKRVVIIGGGIAGLSAAYYLRKSPDVAISLLEGSQRLGGKIGTERIGGLLIEQGPDSIFSAKPAAIELAIELGMVGDLIEPLQHDFSILVNGKLFSVPRALVSLTTPDSGALERAEFFGASTRRRILGEKDVPRGDGRDESIASFFRRRFGRKFSHLLAEPLLAGIHGGDPEKLSMKALYPVYLAREQEMGSLTAPSGTPKNGVGFVSLRNGMESLVDRLSEQLAGVDLIRNAEANRIERSRTGFRIYADGFTPIEADALILALPAYIASYLLREIAPGSASKLNEILHTSTAVVTTAYPRAAFSNEPRGNGFLVPYTEESGITGCTWSSNKWEGRAPDGTLLLRCFMGRDGGLNVDAFSDPELIEKATGEVSRILKPNGAPTYASLRRWTKSMPQKVVGHTELLGEIEAGLAGLPIQLIGASYRSSGIPDCVRDGREAAERFRKEGEG